MKRYEVHVEFEILGSDEWIKETYREFVIADTMQAAAVAAKRALMPSPGGFLTSAPDPRRITPSQGQLFCQLWRIAAVRVVSVAPWNPSQERRVREDP